MPRTGYRSVEEESSRIDSLCTHSQEVTTAANK